MHSKDVQVNQINMKHKMKHQNKNTTGVLYVVYFHEIHI